MDSDGNDRSARAGLRSIGVSVELSSGNIEPLLHEIRHAIQRLLSESSSTTIDLRSLPLAPGEEEQILQRLGKGEARAELSVFGTSELVETDFPGVWVVTHYDTGGAVQARFIEVTRVPKILCSQTRDIAAGLTRLGASLREEAR